MSLWSWIVIAGLLAGLYGWYVIIVTRRNRVAEAMAGIDVQLQQRHDLIPNILTIARRFMEHERSLLEEIAALRARATRTLGEKDFARMGEKFTAEKQLGDDMGRLFALVENYPVLRSDGPMMEAQRSYHEVETNVAAARRFYNATVSELNNAVQIFPGPLLMKLAGMTALPPFFESTPAARAPVSASQFL